jgi:hypothetical protein
MHIVHGYIYGDSYAVPHSDAVRTADRISAREDVAKTSEEPTWRNWHRGCGNSSYWVPRTA